MLAPESWTQYRQRATAFAVSYRADDDRGIDDAGGTPEAIAAGPDGNLWFTDAGDGTQGEIGRIEDGPMPLPFRR